MFYIVEKNQTFNFDIYNLIFKKKNSCGQNYNFICQSFSYTGMKVTKFALLVESSKFLGRILQSAKRK